MFINEFTIGEQRNIKLGQVSIQRIGGYGGRKSAQMLQFKINPAIRIVLP